MLSMRGEIDAIASISLLQKKGSILFSGLTFIVKSADRTKHMFNSANDKERKNDVFCLCIQVANVETPPSRPVACPCASNERLANRSTPTSTARLRDKARFRLKNEASIYGFAVIEPYVFLFFFFFG